MAIIQDLYFFSWKDFHDDVQTLGDLERFVLVIETMPDQKLMEVLLSLRGKGRNDHPIAALWNSILAGIIFDHKSIESLRRELKRNAQLRELCGFSPLLGVAGVPSKSAYNRFMANLVKQEHLVREIFNSLVDRLKTLFPGFGTNLAGDGKAIESLGTPSKKNAGDKRREKDADWGVKKYRGMDKDGNAWEKTKSWFGFRLHLVVDADAELPIAYALTKASTGEQPVMEELFTALNKDHPEIVDRCEHAMFDKGYDSEERIVGLWQKYKIKAIVDIRKMWKDGEETRALKTRAVKNVTYDYKGTVFCHCPETGEMKPMAYKGFEEKRESHKYVCPAKEYGIACQGTAKCPIYQKTVRIPMKEDLRIFTPVARSTYKWKRLYKKRSSVERVNSRIDVSFGFEQHYIRGINKMELRCGLALSVMLAIAVGRLNQKHPELMRSLVKSAA